MESEPIRLTHGAFLARLHRMARLFRELGVARGEVVTLLVPSIPDAVLALWAAEAVGIAHPVNTLLRATDIAAMMCAAGSRVVVALGAAGRNGRQGGRCRTGDASPARGRRAGRPPLMILLPSRSRPGSRRQELGTKAKAPSRSTRQLGASRNR